MAQANPLELATWAIMAGWRSPGDAATATAVAMRAGSDPEAGAGLYGLGSSGSGFAQTVAAQNFWEARGKDWNVLPPYAAGGWQIYLPIAAPAAAAAWAGINQTTNPGNTTEDTVVDAAEATVPDNPYKTFERIGLFIQSPDGWQRIIKVGLGASLVVVAAVYVFYRTGPAQVMRGIRKAGEYADVVQLFRSRNAGPRADYEQAKRDATARSQAASEPKPAAKKTTRRTVTSGGGPRKTAPKPTREPKRAEPTPWSERPTEERPIVRFRGVAKPPPRKLPGSGETRVTGEGRRNAREKAGRGAKG